MGKYMMDIIDVPFGTRFVGYYEQEPVNNKSDVIKIIQEHLGIDNIAISISTYKNREPYLLFLPFDFDSNDLRKSWDDAKRLFNYTVRNKISSYLSYSGRKGFHVLILTKPKVYTKRQIRGVQNYYKKLLSLNTVDQQIFGDRRRLMRIPGTYNINGELCRILAINDEEKLDLDEIYTDTELPIMFTRDNNISRDKLGIYHDYPCIELMIRNDTEPRHLIRFAYAILRFDEGFTIDEILDEIESFGWQDFNEEYTRKQLEHIRDRNYVPPSCETLRELGYCNIDNCEHAKTNNEILKEVGIL